MTLTAISLLLVSTVIHATWNLIGKREDPSKEFFLTANSFGCVCLAVLSLCMAAYSHTDLRLIGGIPASIWILIAVTGVFQAIYFSGLAAAYSSGHLSVAYPLIRSVPVVLVAVVSAAMGKAHQLTPISLAGMALIAVGSLILPVGRFSDWKLRDYIHPSSLFVLLAAIGTTGYSIMDDSALRLLKAVHGISADRATMTVLYAFLEGLSTSFWLGLFVLCGRRGRRDSAKPKRLRVGSASLAGVGIFSAYVLVLMAMTYSRNVSYVVAFRQLSIPIGAILGVTVLKEPKNAPKLIGMAIMLAGLLLVALR